jgi:hypothetical protein
MGNYKLTQRSTGKSFNVKARNVNEAKVKLNKYLLENRKRAIVETVVQRAVRQALNEVANEMDEALGGYIKGAAGAIGNKIKQGAQAAGGAIRKFGNDIKQGAQAASNQQNANTFNRKAEKKSQKVKARIDKVIDQFGGGDQQAKAAIKQQLSQLIDRNRLVFDKSTGQNVTQGSIDDENKKNGVITLGSGAQNGQSA